MAYLPPAMARRNPDAIGVPIPGGELEVRSADGLPDDVGELVYQGPNVMMGYATIDADLAPGATIDELRTGDLGRFRPDDGVFEIVGRRSRYVKPFGVRVDLDEVERALAGEVARRRRRRAPRRGGTRCRRGRHPADGRRARRPTTGPCHRRRERAGSPHRRREGRLRRRASPRRRAAGRARARRPPGNGGRRLRRRAGMAPDRPDQHVRVARRRLAELRRVLDPARTPARSVAHRLAPPSGLRAGSDHRQRGVSRGSTPRCCCGPSGSAPSSRPTWACSTSPAARTCCWPSPGSTSVGSSYRSRQAPIGSVPVCEPSPGRRSRVIAWVAVGIAARWRLRHRHVAARQQLPRPRPAREQRVGLLVHRGLRPRRAGRHAGDGDTCRAPRRASIPLSASSSPFSPSASSCAWSGPTSATRTTSASGPTAWPGSSSSGGSFTARPPCGNGSSRRRSAW